MSLDDYEVSSDPGRIDVDVVHEFLRTSYWAEGRERETTEITVKNSLCFGGYLSGQQVAFGRVVTDRAIIGYLADIFVLPEFRGRGFGRTLVRTILEHPDVARLQVILLRTRDAHSVYQPFGFCPLPRPEEMMARYPRS
jgi:GNAT superfamily N-acetyltransferase